MAVNMIKVIIPQVDDCLEQHHGRSIITRPKGRESDLSEVLGDRFGLGEER